MAKVIDNSITDDMSKSISSECNGVVSEVDTFEDDCSDLDSEFSEVSTCRRVSYSKKETSAIREECRSFLHHKGNIDTVSLEQLFKTNKRLIPLYKKFSWKSLKIKISTEKKKIQKR